MCLLSSFKVYVHRACCVRLSAMSIPLSRTIWKQTQKNKEVLVLACPFHLVHIFCMTLSRLTGPASVSRIPPFVQACWEARLNHG